jgi:hypothetical protein
MKTKITIALIILFNIHLYSQNDYFTVQKIKVSHSNVIERGFNSKEDFRDHKIHFANKSFEWGKPKIFKRSSTENFPPASVWYIYSANDSIVRKVDYNWYVKYDKTMGQSDKIALFNIEYDKIVLLISKYFGKPQPNQGEITKEVMNVVVTDKIVYEYRRQTTWEYKNCKIVTFLVWADNHGQSFSTQISWE